MRRSKPFIREVKDKKGSVVKEVVIRQLNELNEEIERRSEELQELRALRECLVEVSGRGLKRVRIDCSGR